jgi:hypothetical protein
MDDVDRKRLFTTKFDLFACLCLSVISRVLDEKQSEVKHKHYLHISPETLYGRLQKLCSSMQNTVQFPLVKGKCYLEVAKRLVREHKHTVVPIAASSIRSMRDRPDLSRIYDVLCLVFKNIRHYTELLPPPVNDVVKFLSPELIEDCAYDPSPVYGMSKDCPAKFHLSESEVKNRKQKDIERMASNIGTSKVVEYVQRVNKGEQREAVARELSKLKIERKSKRLTLIEL